MLADNWNIFLGLAISGFVATLKWHGFVWLGIAGSILFILAAAQSVWQIATVQHRGFTPLDWDDDSEDN